MDVEDVSVYGIHGFRDFTVNSQVADAMVSIMVRENLRFILRTNIFTNAIFEI